MPYVKVNDIHMYYEIHGDGEPLLLIVGLATDISEWDGIIHWLAKKYQVLAFDNRGAGRTDKPYTHYSIEMMANDTAGLMQTLGMEQAHILGISMGVAYQTPGLPNKSRTPAAIYPQRNRAAHHPARMRTPVLLP